MLVGAVGAPIDNVITLFRGFRSSRERTRTESGTATATPDRPATQPIGAAVAREVAPDAAVAFDRVSLAFDKHVVLRDLSFQIPPGAMRILLGRSGAGKSLVLKLILGLLRPDAGAVYVTAGASTPCPSAICWGCAPTSGCCSRRTRCSIR